MRYLLLGSSLRGLADVARSAVADGHEVLLYDAERPGAPHDLAGMVTVLDATWSPSMLDGVDRVVTSPWFSERVPPLSDVLARGTDVITEAGYGLERLDIPYVAVTGTNGKTTVTEVTAAMLQASGIDALAAGNVGTPLSGLDSEAAEVLVLELSSYQLRFIGSLDARAVALLNIAPDHLDWHGSMDAYADAKAEIAHGRRSPAPFAYNADDARVLAIAATADPPTIACSGTHLPDNGNGVDGDRLIVDGRSYPVGTDDATGGLESVADTVRGTTNGTSWSGWGVRSSSVCLRTATASSARSSSTAITAARRRS